MSHLPSAHPVANNKVFSNPPSLFGVPACGPGHEAQLTEVTQDLWALRNPRKQKSDKGRAFSIE
jgi:hypothetical protein